MAQQTRDINQSRQWFKVSENITTYGKRASSRQVMHGASVMLNCSNASLDADSYCLTDVFGQSAAIMGYSSYAPSKMAVRGLADTLRHEVSLSNCSIHFGRSFSPQHSFWQVIQGNSMVHTADDCFCSPSTVPSIGSVPMGIRMGCPCYFQSVMSFNLRPTRRQAGRASRQCWHAGLFHHCYYLAHNHDRWLIAMQLCWTNVKISIGYPPDTDTPGYDAEQKIKVQHVGLSGHLNTSAASEVQKSSLIMWNVYH